MQRPWFIAALVVAGLVLAGLLIVGNPARAPHHFWPGVTSQWPAKIGGLLA